MADSTTAVKPRKPPALVETRVDADGVHITLPKASAVALTKARDVLAALGAAAPTIRAKALGLRNALNGLIDDLSHGPLPAESEEQS